MSSTVGINRVFMSVYLDCRGLEEYSEIDKEWFKNSRYLACLAARDEADLKNLAARCKEQDLSYSVNREPDFDNAITAIAIEPTPWGRRVTSSFPLALRSS